MPARPDPPRWGRSPSSGSATSACRRRSALAPGGAAGRRGRHSSRTQVRSIRRGIVDLTASDHERLGRAIADAGPASRSRATPDAIAGGRRRHRLRAYARGRAPAARPGTRCVAPASTWSRYARPGQRGSSWTSTTLRRHEPRDLLASRSARRGLSWGIDVFVAFAPERIDLGNAALPAGDVPRVVGGRTGVPGVAAAVSEGQGVIRSRPEAAELQAATRRRSARSTSRWQTNSPIMLPARAWMSPR